MEENNKMFRKLVIKFVIVLAVITITVQLLLEGSDQLAWTLSNFTSEPGREEFWYTLYIVVDGIYRIFLINDYFIIIIASTIALLLLVRKELRIREKNLNAIALATAEISKGRTEMISLPDDLKEIERQMNQIISESENKKRAIIETEQRKNNLIVYLAHDLKTPLTSIIGYIDLLKEESNLSDENKEKYLSIALKKAKKLDYLINEFFDITRFNLSEIELNYQNINITRFIEQMSSEYAIAQEKKNIKCTLDLEKDVEIKCDVDKIERVIDNLMTNAVRYSQEGGEINIFLKRIGHNVVLQFRNTGETLPEEKLKRVFDQFYRSDESRQSETGGTGLGLAITKKIVEIHGGTIEAMSQDGYVEFVVILPITSFEKNSEEIDTNPVIGQGDNYVSIV